MTFDGDPGAFRCATASVATVSAGSTNTYPRTSNHRHRRFDALLDPGVLSTRRPAGAGLPPHACHDDPFAQCLVKRLIPAFGLSAASQREQRFRCSFDDFDVIFRPLGTERRRSRKPNGLSSILVQPAVSSSVICSRSKARRGA